MAKLRDFQLVVVVLQAFGIAQVAAYSCTAVAKWRDDSSAGLTGSGTGGTGGAGNTEHGVFDEAGATAAPTPTTSTAPPLPPATASARLRPCACRGGGGGAGAGGAQYQVDGGVVGDGDGGEQRDDAEDAKVQPAQSVPYASLNWRARRGRCACVRGHACVRRLARQPRYNGGAATAIARRRHRQRRRRRQPRRRDAAALAAELLNSNLKNYAGVRLRAPADGPRLLLDAVRRRTTAVARGGGGTAHQGKDCDPGRVPRTLAPPRSAAANVPNVSTSPMPPMSPVSPVLPVSLASGATPAPRRPTAGACPAQIRILTFNALKLRVDAPALAREWAELAAVFNAHDVVVLQEVSARLALFQPRFLDGLLAKLRRLDATWRYVRSEPSGGSPRDGSLEVHIVLYKPPVELKSGVAPTTLTTVAGVAMAHAPLVVTLHAHGLELNVVSVHLPPASTARRPERDRQLRALLSYPLEAALRNQRIFRRDGRRFVLHLLAGDFNASPGELRRLAEEAAPRTWTRCSAARARRAKRGYDNFLAHFDDAFYASWTPSVEVSPGAPRQLCARRGRSATTRRCARRAALSVGRGAAFPAQFHPVGTFPWTRRVLSVFSSCRLERDGEGPSCDSPRDQQLHPDRGDAPS